MKKKGFWSRFFALVDGLHLVVAVAVGVAAAYLLGGVVGSGLPGYAGGFVLGTGIVLGGISLGLD